MRGLPAGSPRTLRGFHWYGPGEPTEGDIAISEKGHAAYLVEAAIPARRCNGHCRHADEVGAYTLWTLETTKLDPDDLPAEPDWVIAFG